MDFGLLVGCLRLAFLVFIEGGRMFGEGLWKILVR